MQSPSTISYESAIFDNVDFVATPTLVFGTPRHQKRIFKENLVTRSIEYYNVCESTDLTTLSDTTMQQATSVLQVAESCNQTTAQENMQYTTLETVRQDFTIDQNILYTTPVDNENSDILILQCEKTAVESNDPDFLVENQSTTTENVPSVSDVPSTTKELTRKRRQHKENWERVKNKKQKILAKFILVLIRKKSLIPKR